MTHILLELFYRQYYSYVTDKQCKRLGSQAWVFACITLSELILNIKFGLDLFSRTQISKMLLWIILNIIISFLGVLVSVLIVKWRYERSSGKKGECFNRNFFGVSEESKIINFAHFSLQISLKPRRGGKKTEIRTYFISIRKFAA